MPLNNHVLNVLEHALELDVIKFDSFKEEEGAPKISHEIGGPVPMIVINGVSFLDQDIKRMEINCNVKIPTIDATIIDTRGTLDVDNIPRDGDVISVRIAARQQDTFRDIRIDFDIDEVSGPPTRDLEKATKGAKYTFSGTMKIPTMHSEGCASYEGTSREQIEEFATNLKLGLATNIDSADDNMKALNACQPNFEFLNNLVEHSYIGEDSFQTYSIDPYYNICYVDVNALLNSEEGVDETFVNFEIDFDEDGEEQSSNKIQMSNILTNASSMNATNTFIESYNLINNSGALSKRNGYKRKMIYYENDSEGIVAHELEPLASENMKDIEEPLKGRRGEDRYQQEVKSKYVGRLPIQSDEAPNVHLNYSYSAISNKQNIDEMNKMKLELTLKTFNPGIHLWQKIPVQIMKGGFAQITAQQQTNKDKDEKGFDTDQELEAESANDLNVDQVRDEFLSGYYIIGGIIYMYKPSTGITQKLTLLRREWPSRMSEINEETLAEETPPPTPPAPEPEPTPEPVVEEPVVEEPEEELEELEITLTIDGEGTSFSQSESNYLSITGTWESNRDFEGFEDVEIEFESTDDDGIWGYPQITPKNGEAATSGTWEFKSPEIIYEDGDYEINITFKAEDKEFTASSSMTFEYNDSLYTYEITRQGPKKGIVVYKEGVEVYRGVPAIGAAEEMLVEEAKLELDSSQEDDDIQNMRPK
jgi:hypothetical protein